MDREWNDSQAIYRQLRDRVVGMILDGVLKKGDLLPSVRNVAGGWPSLPVANRTVGAPSFAAFREGW